MLNPNAWANPPAGQFGSSALYYDDYRSQRRPLENMNVGRTFRIREQVQLNVRIEFANVFNRAYWNDPAGANLTNAATISRRDPVTGVYTSGFGLMPVTSSYRREYGATQWHAGGANHFLTRWRLSGRAGIARTRRDVQGRYKSSDTGIE